MISSIQKELDLCVALSLGDLLRAFSATVHGSHKHLIEHGSVRVERSCAIGNAFEKRLRIAMQATLDVRHKGRARFSIPASKRCVQRIRQQLSVHHRKMRLQEGTSQQLNLPDERNDSRAAK